MRQRENRPYKEITPELARSVCKTRAGHTWLYDIRLVHCEVPLLHRTVTLPSMDKAVALLYERNAACRNLRVVGAWQKYIKNKLMQPVD